VKVVCPSCGAAVAPGDINITAMSAVCRGCGEVFTLTAEPVATVPQPPPDGARPSRVVVEDIGGAMRLGWSWWEWQYLVLGFFCVFWDGFLVVWYAIALGIFGNSHGQGHGMEWVMVLFPMIHVAIGVWLTYSVVAAVVNRTTIDVDAERIAARIGPLPWRGGNVSIERAQVRQLHVVRTETRGRNGVSVSYSLAAELASGGRQWISRRFAGRDHADFVARMIASALRVPLIEE
jgi:hypothetical protein